MGIFFQSLVDAAGHTGNAEMIDELFLKKLEHIKYWRPGTSGRVTGSLF
ncbi:hypothetical protein LQ567_02255 [Niabella pedocola]|uniref:Uncharacterized protein n=1 Tax=Niabella pedocola TaxID=1752077 RepID=A0ABS8PP38_9BACT|nr:hypothetical protein [Niabella pedocola]MCD2421566.1 hypothetical protein [Niabella pedocola]